MLAAAQAGRRGGRLATLLEPFLRCPGMHRQGMEADGKFISQEAIDQAMAGEGLESSEVVADGQQPEVRLTIRGGIVLGGFVDQFQMEGT